MSLREMLNRSLLLRDHGRKLILPDGAASIYVYCSHGQMLLSLVSEWMLHLFLGQPLSSLKRWHKSRHLLCKNSDLHSWNASENLRLDSAMCLLTWRTIHALHVSVTWLLVLLVLRNVYQDGISFLCKGSGSGKKKITTQNEQNEN